MSMEDYDRKCVCCGTVRYVTYLREWKWKFRNKFCCSYTCMRKMEKEAQKIDICEFGC